MAEETGRVSISSAGSPLTRDAVITVDGKAIKGVSQVTITAAPGDVWRAHVDLLPAGVELGGLRADSVVYRVVALVCPVCHTLADWVRAQQEGISPRRCPHGGGANPDAATIPSGNVPEPAPAPPVVDDGKPKDPKDKPDKGKS